MINFVALSLLFSTLASAGIFSPRPPEPPPPPPQQELHQNDPLVRRIIVVEYERQFRDDQVPHRRPTSANELVEEAKEKFHAAAALHPSADNGVSLPAPAKPEAAYSVKNVMCDAYGVCKETISSLAGKGSKKAGEVKEAAKDVVDAGKATAGKLTEGAKNAVKGAASKAGEVTEGAVKSAASKAGEMTEGAKEAAKGTASKAGKVTEGAEDAVAGAVDKASELKEEISSGISSMSEMAAGKVEQKKEQLRRTLTDILRRARAGAPEIGRGAAAILHLVGLATAYGTYVWVIFVSSHVLAMALPRQQFGAVQSKLYPVYFRAVGYGITLAILGQFFCRRRERAGIQFARCIGASSDQHDILGASSY